MGETYRFSGALWEYSGQGKWIFVTVPPDQSEEIREMPRPPKPGFGSIRVRVSLGASSWTTSVFPDSKSGCYMLPVKKAIRVAETVDTDDLVEVELEPLE